MRKLSLTLAAGLVSAALLAASQTVALAGKPEAVPAVAPDAASPPALAGGVDSLKNTAVPAVAPETPLHLPWPPVQTRSSATSTPRATTSMFPGPMRPGTAGGRTSTATPLGQS